MPVDTEEKLNEEERRRLEEEKLAEAEYKRNMREAARLDAEEKRQRAAERQRQQEDMDRTIEEAQREDAERTSYNKSWKGRAANRLGRGKYQKQKASDEGGEEKKSKKGGSPMDPTRLPSGSGEKAKTDGMTYFVVGVAALIWLMDSIDFRSQPLGYLSFLSVLGDRYIGFNFDFFGLMRTNWLAVGTTTIVIALLTYNTLRGIFERKATFFLSFLTILAIFQVWGKGWYEIPVLYGNIIFGAIIILAFILIYRHREVLGDYGSFIFMTLFFSFFWINWGWYGNMKARIHVIYILFFGFAYLGSKLYDNPFAWHVITPTLLFVDFYGYSLSSGYEVFRHIPLLMISVALICWMINPKTFFPPIVLSIVVLSIIGVSAASGADTTEQYQGTLNFQTPQTVTASLMETVSKIWSGIVGTTESQLSYATGGYYTSQVEKNQYEPLGVYLDKVRASQPRFYVQEPVTLWSTIKSRTLSDPVVVRFTCYRWNGDKPISVQKDDTVIPDFPFVVYTLEEKDVECTFRNKFEPGSNTATLSATYNFATSAYRKAYFMDADRFRAMGRENLDPLKEYGITDQKPKTIFTNGPVDIDITIQNLVTVSENPDVKPLLGIKLKNRNKITDKDGKAVGEWQGKIKTINELVVVLPDTIEIEKKSCLPVEFDDFTLDNCYSSCKDVCPRACKVLSENQKDKETDCINKCSADTTKQCDEECKSLFKADAGDINYKGYQLKVDEIKGLQNSKEYLDIDRDKDFACRINPRPKVLENVPITTKTIRARARYNYELTQTYSVPVVATPTLPSEQALISDLYGSIPPIVLQGIHFNPSNQKEIDYSNILYQKVTSIQPPFDYLLIKALIEKESGWVETADSLDRNGKHSYGLMQIQEDTGKNCQGNWKTEAAANIECGIEVLKSKCNEFKPYCLAPKPQCNSAADCRHPFGQSKEYCQEAGKYYLCRSDCQDKICVYEFTGDLKKPNFYSGEFAALRAYNGWGAGNEGYVENIMKNYDILKAKVKAEQTP